MAGPPPLPVETVSPRTKPLRLWASLVYGALFVGLLIWSYAPIIRGDAFSYWWYPEFTTAKIAGQEWAEAQAWKEVGQRWASEEWLEGAQEMETNVLEKLEQAEARFLPGAETNQVGEILLAHAILLNEAGRSEAAEAKWRELGRIVGKEELAQLGISATRGDVDTYDSERVFRLMGFQEDGWLYRTFQKSVTRAAGELALSDGWERHARSISWWVLGVGFFTMAAFWILLVSGLLAAVWIWRSRNGVARPRDTLAMGEGVGIWVRGEVCGLLAVTMVGWILFADLQWLSSTIASLIRGGPLVLLAFVRFQRNGISLADGLGIRFPEGQRLRLLAAGLAVYGIDMLLNLGLEPFFRRMEGAEGYTESIRELLIYHTIPYRLLALADGCLFAPIMEEIAYRGLVFRALRSRFGFAASAGISSALFAGMHFYSLPGSISVFFFGFVSAWMVEKTRSLVPSILGHCLMNLFLLGSQFLYFL